MAVSKDNTRINVKLSKADKALLKELMEKVGYKSMSKFAENILINYMKNKEK